MVIRVTTQRNLWTKITFITFNRLNGISKNGNVIIKLKVRVIIKLKDKYKVKRKAMYTNLNK